MKKPRVGPASFSVALIITLCVSAQASSETLIDKAKIASPDRYLFAIEKKAQIVATEDHKSFYVLWYPKSYSNVEKPPLIVTLHGHGSWALDEFYLWYPEAQKRGYGILAIQYWFGEGEGRPEDYYTPKEIYPVISSVLRREGARSRSALLHGFSRGSANVYAVAAHDRSMGESFFGMVIANAGSAEPDYPPNREISSGRFGSVFSGSHWVFYCGERDPSPQRSGCESMHRSAEWVKDFGGAVDLFIDDPEGDHGGFHRNPENVKKALDAFKGQSRSLNGW